MTWAEPRGGLLVFVITLLALLIACTDGAVSDSVSKPSVDPVGERLMGLPFDAMVSLGPHSLHATLEIADEAPKRSFESTETYDLQWEGWRSYAYRIVKEDRPTLNVVIDRNTAYQIRSDGRARARENVHDFHYYLQQTWNLWSVAARPFGDTLSYTPVETTSRGGRPTTHYKIGLKSTGLLLDEGSGTGTMRTQLLTAEGDLWMDDATGMCVEVDFSGGYKTIRMSRVPGRPDAETDHSIRLKLSRSDIGKSQNIQIPTDLISPSPRAPAPLRGAGSRSPTQRRPSSR